jgi:hypothetical protein
MSWSTDARAARMHAWILACLQRRAKEHLEPMEATARLWYGDVHATSAELLGCPPIAFDLSKVRVVPLYDSWPENETQAVLNGALVALLAVPMPLDDAQAAAWSSLSVQELQVHAGITATVCACICVAL